MLQNIQNYINSQWNHLTTSVYDLLGLNEDESAKMSDDEKAICSYVNALMYVQLQSQLGQAYKQPLIDLLDKNPGVKEKLDSDKMNEIYQGAKQFLIKSYNLSDDAFDDKFEGSIEGLLLKS